MYSIFTEQLTTHSTSRTVTAANAKVPKLNHSTNPLPILFGQEEENIFNFFKY